MKKENNKLREAAKKERNEQCRVGFAEHLIVDSDAELS